MPSSDPQPIWSVRDILSATGGSLVCGDAQLPFRKPAIDSRTLDSRDAFVAICGVRHDGHQFVPAVTDKGCRVVVVQADHREQLPLKKWRTQGLSCVAVADTTQALGAMARYHRRRMPAKVVAITGSNGKTTTKEFTRAVFEQAYAVLATTGNLNNEIGLPLTLFDLCPEHHWAVLELGMNHGGEITYLGSICEPDMGIITNVGPVHIEGLGSIEGVREAKAELLPTIRENGYAVLNADDPQVRMLQGRVAREVWVGLSEEAQVRATQIRVENGQTRFLLHLPEQAPLEVRLQFINPVMVGNALAAAAAGWLADIAPAQIQAGLAKFAPTAGRMQVRMIGDGVNLIDDSYNANPVSMRAALETLASVAGGGRRIMVLGDMFELGREALRRHLELGLWAGQLGAHGLYLAGEYAEAVAAGAKRGGLSADRIFIGDHGAIGQALKKRLKSGDWLLIKGSRGMAMEGVLPFLAPDGSV